MKYFESHSDWVTYNYIYSFIISWLYPNCEVQHIYRHWTTTHILLRYVNNSIVEITWSTELAIFILNINMSRRKQSHPKSIKRKYLINLKWWLHFFNWTCRGFCIMAGLYWNVHDIFACFLVLRGMSFSNGDHSPPPEKIKYDDPFFF